MPLRWERVHAHSGTRRRFVTEGAVRRRPTMLGLQLCDRGQAVFPA
jgi:hypothetical protein